MSYSTGFRMTAAEVGDVNGDGKLDVVVSNAGTATSAGASLSVFVNQGAGTFGAGVNYATAGNLGSLALADFNGDGKVDAVIGPGFGATLSVLLNQGTGAFAAPLVFNAGVFQSAMIAGDYNGDGKVDVAVGGPGGTNVLYQQCLPDRQRRAVDSAHGAAERGGEVAAPPTSTRSSASHDCMHRSSPTCHRAPRARTRRRSPRPHPERRNRSPLATRRCCPCRGRIGRGGCPPRPPQIRTCATHASGSSVTGSPPRHVGCAMRGCGAGTAPAVRACAPSSARALRAAVKPLAPRAGDLAPEASKGIQVPGDPEVPVTSPQLLREGLLLRSQVVVEVLAAPTGNLTERSPKAVLKALGRKLAKPHQQPASRPRHS